MGVGHWCGQRVGGSGAGEFNNKFKVLFCLLTIRTKHKGEHFRYLKNFHWSLVSILGLIYTVTQESMFCT